MEKIKRALLRPAKCAVDLGDGSERGSYVDQDYILRKMGRPHRAVNLMYCYYPLDREWPARISEVTQRSGDGAWDYAYDDYFPFTGDTPFEQIRDIRRHGQDVIFTLTADPRISDEQITEVARKFRPCGRLMLRLNHEATGNWFSFNKRCTYREVADFFVRFTRICHREAPNVRMILCTGGVEVPGSEKIEREEEFAPAVRETDIWSMDKYPSLNWGWPNEIAEKTNHQHNCQSLRRVFDIEKNSFERFRFLNGGVRKPMQLCEHNEDGDVTGPFLQAKRLADFYDLIEREGEWLSAITLYQFRDDGRLGLEITDPNNKNVGIEQPALKAYRQIIHRPYFAPVLTDEEPVSLPAQLRWGGSEDAEGVSIPVTFEKQPVFAEAYFDGESRGLALMLELNGRWLYKAPGVGTVDLMPVFYELPLEGPAVLPLRLFAPPADGMNAPDGHEDWQINYRRELKELPRLRLRFEPVGE